MIPKPIIRGFMYIRKMLLVIKNEIEMVWFSADFNLSVPFMFIDKKGFHLVKFCPVQIPESLSMSCLPRLNCIYKLICQINKRSMLGFQQEIAYYLNGSFQI